MRVATITTAGNEIKCEFPFDASALKAIKAVEGRRWDGQAKAWFVPAGSKAEAVSALAEFFKVVDTDSVGEGGAKLAKLDAMTDEIIENQKCILDNQERIEELIADMGGKIGRYSYTSHSRIKADLASDRALLQHALDNARLDPDRMTELQIRGLAAAVRFLEG